MHLAQPSSSSTNPSSPRSYSAPQAATAPSCAGPSAKSWPPAAELDFAAGLLNDVVTGLPPDRLGLHICRGNWTRDESAALSGDYRPLLDLLKRVQVGTLFLELSTPRAGDAGILRSLPDDKRIAIGVVNQKLDAVESPEDIRRSIDLGLNLFGRERLLLTPDCGFATFADNPVASANTAEAKLRAIAQARDLVAVS